MRETYHPYGLPEIRSFADLKRIRPNWFGIFLFGGVALTAIGVDQLKSGQDRFSAAISQCEHVLVSLDPPVYSLKKPTDVCVQLERGVPAQDLLAQFEATALQDRPWGVGKLVTGAVSAVGALLIGFGLPLLRSRRG